MTTPKPITDTQLLLFKPFIRFFSNLNAQVYKWTNGMFMGRMGGGDVCVVRMTGAKTGRVLELPLMYVPYKDGLILVASLGGAPRHPGWYHNLVAHPEIEVLWRGERKRLTARRATPAEKFEVWPVCCAHYRDFDLYQRRTTRDIPVFICEPSAVAGGIKDV